MRITAKLITFILVTIYAQGIFSQQLTAEVQYLNGTVDKILVDDLYYLSYTQPNERIFQSDGITPINLDLVKQIDIPNKGVYLTRSLSDSNLEKPVLCYLKIDGTLKLLYQGSDIFIEKDNKLFQLKEIKTDLEVKKEYRKTLAQIVENDEKYLKLLPDTEFSKTSIEEFVNTYNTDYQSSHPNRVYSPNSKMKINYLMGVAMRFDKGFDATGLAPYGRNFSSFTFSGEVSFSDPDFSDLLSLTVGVWYLKDSYFSDGFEIPTIVEFEDDSSLIIGANQSFDYSSNAIEIPVYLEVNNLRKIVSYYGAFGFSYKSRSYTRDFGTNGIKELKAQGAHIILEMGGAFNLSKNFTLNVSYNIDTQINIRARARF